jgi:hypothetical protein
MRRWIVEVGRPDGATFYVSISGNGAFVASDSRADNLSSKDDNDYSNAFLRRPLP